MCGSPGMQQKSSSQFNERTGIKIELISGQEEGRLAYLAVQAGLGLGDGSLVVFDTGGGSTQFTFGRGPEVAERFSVDVGAVRFTERFKLDGVVAPEVLDEALAAISNDLSRIDGRGRPDHLERLALVPSPHHRRSILLPTHDPDAVQGTVLDHAEIKRQIEMYRSMDAEARRSIVGLQPQRADIILAGACIVSTVMRKLESCQTC